MSLTVFRRLTRLITPAESEPQDYPFAEEDVARLHRLTPGDEAAALDEQTWRDLLLDRYSEALAPGVSIFGRQVLYRRLRAGVDDFDAVTRRERVAALLADPEGLDGLERTLRSLRHADIEVASLLFDPAEMQPVRPAWLGWWALLPLGLVASIAAALLLSPGAWIVTAVVMALLAAPQMRYMESMSTWRRKTAALQLMLRVCSLLDGSPLPLAADFAGRGAQAGRINRSLARSIIGGLVPGSREYADWFMLANVRHYFKTLAIVFGQRDFLGECYRRCAALEADVALARHLRATSLWCWSERSAPRRMAVEEGVHPLLEDASGLSVTLDGKGSFVSGQNGVGKSTLLRMLGLNLAAARAFGFCYARRASLPAIPVVASMQNEDSLLGGQSLYIAELARARDMLAAAHGEHPVVCLIDEIFRGTNHEESVSAAAAVLDELARHALVVVSSHNLVLGPLLAHRLEPWRVARGAMGALRLERGILGRTNGIALLASHGFGAALQDKAGRVAAWLAGQRHAEGGADLLAE
jgi:hypothetical protein